MQRIVPTQAAWVANQPVGGDAAAERTASQASTSGQEGSGGSEITDPEGEPIQSRQRTRGQTLHMNGVLVYRMADWEVVERAGDHPVYSVDYFFLAVSPTYLAALREEFGIPENMELVMPSPNDLPSRPPPGNITLSAKFSEQGSVCPFIHS